MVGAPRRLHHLVFAINLHTENRLKLLRFSPLLALAIGALLISTLVACGGGANKTVEAAQSAAETATLSPTSTPSPTPTPLPPTPTPTPFAGTVARIKSSVLNIDAPIEELAINSANELDTPKKQNVDVGWYYIYDRPGWGGNALFSAHVYYREIPGPFVDLAKAKSGDQIQVVMEDGTQYTYQVISNQRILLENIDMGKIIWPPERGNKEWITLITCGGQFDPVTRDYFSRDIIVAERVS